NPTFAVHPNDDWVQGWEWSLGETVTLSIYDPSTGNVYTDTAEVVVADWDPDQTHFGFDLRDLFDIQPGHEVTVSDGTITKTHTVTDLAGTGIDYEADTVSGTAEPGSSVSVWHCDEGRCWNRDVVADGSGEWTADFGGLLDIVRGMEFEAAQYDEDSDSTQIRIYGQFLQVRVNQSHNWVNGETTPGSTVVVTVWRDGLPIMADRTDNGGGSGWHIDFPGDEELRLQVGDVVEVETSRGLTASVEVIPIEAQVDASGDMVSGQLGEPPDVYSSADVRVEVWQPDGAGQEAQTDGSGVFDVTFTDYDIMPGHMVFIAYVQPDGHQVGIIRHALELEVYTDSDVVRGQTTPGSGVTVTLNSETVSATSDAEGYFEAPFDGDIQIGDTIAASADGQFASLDVVYVSAFVDESDDTVSGYGPPPSSDNDNIEVCLDHDCRWTRTDDSSYYEVQYEREITPEDRLRVQYQYPEGHRAYYGFGPADVGVDKWAPIWNVSPGDEFTYIIRFYNSWSGTATNVQITDTLPLSVTYLAGDLGPAYDEDTHTLTWDIGTLGGDREKEIELHLQLVDDPELLGSRLSNTVEISADNDRDPGNNSSRNDVDISPPGADYWVDKELVSDGAIPGGVITYRVSFGNHGNRDGDGAVLTETLPADTTFEGSTYDECVVSEAVQDGVVTWSLATLPPGGDEGCQLEFSLRIADEAEPDTTFLTNEIAISQDTSEWADNRDNRRVHNTVVQEPAADLWVDKVIEGDLSDPGSEILYRITFRNDGNIDAQDVTLTDTLPLEMTHLWHSAGSVAAEVDGTITWSLGTVSSGAGGVLLIGTRLTDPDAPSVMTNTVEGTTSTPEMDYGNNSAQVALGPPRAIAVPWVGDDPHRVWSGLETTLKGVAKGYGLTHFEWDPGDDSDVISGSIDDPYAIEARHVYEGEVGDTFVATLTVWGAYGWSHSDTYPVQLFSRVHGVEKDVAIDEGLWFLHRSAQRYRSGGLPFAEWAEGDNRAAQNATALQAFQVH
ncbi:MAG: DUF11 domain-containing protein, partial [Anaerolineae bacterium]